MKARIRQEDWQDAWSSDHPVEVEFGDGKTAYLSEAAAVDRLALKMGWTEQTARTYLVIEGRTIGTGTGSRYVLLTEPRAAAS